MTPRPSKPRSATVSMLLRPPGRVRPPRPDDDPEPGLVARLRDWLRGALLDNSGLKLVSLILALTLFVLVNTDEDREITARIGVSYAMPADRVLVSERLDDVRVTIKGPWRRIKRFDEREVDRIQIDLTKVDGGELAITPDLIRLPEGLEITSISPRTVRVAFERRLDKDVEIQPVFTGRPLHGYAEVRDQRVVSPRTVKVRGAEGVVSALTAVRTQEIRLDGRSGELSLEVKLAPPDGVEVAPPGPVTVKVHLAPERVERRVPSVAVTVRVDGIDNPRWVAEPATVVVVLEGRLLQLEEAIAGGLRPVAALTAAEIGVDRPVRAKLRLEGVPSILGWEIVPAEVVIKPRK